MASTSWRAKLIAKRNLPARYVAGAEAQQLARILAEPMLWLLVALMALGGALAYLMPYEFALDIGGSPKGCYAESVFDAPYIKGFNTEPEFDGPAELCTARTVAYRWAFEDATIRVRGIGRAAYSVLLRLASGQPSGQPVVSAWAVNNLPLLGVAVLPEARTYHLFAPPAASADLALHFHTLPYQPPGDVRALAFAVDRVDVSSLGRTAPDWSQLTILSATIALGYVMARHWLLDQRIAAAVLLSATGAFVALLIWQRQGLTMFAPRMLVLVLAGYCLALVLEPLAYHGVGALGLHAPRSEARAVVALVVVAWLVRVLGLFHPQTFSSDVGLHMNNLLGVTRGEIIFTEGLPAEAGGGDAPYPPAQYIMLAPWQLLGLDARALVTVANALVDSLAIVWIWLVLRVMTAPPAAAYAAGGLYLFATPLLRSLSTGEMANVWGQALVLPWLLALLLWRQHRVGSAVLCAATAIALLGHSGVFLSLVLLLATLGAIWLVRRDPHVWQFALVVALAVACVSVVYYLAFLDLSGSRTGAVPATTTPMQRLGLEARELVMLTGQIGLLLTGAGLAGAAVAWHRWRQLGEVLGAWWLSAVLSWATLLVSQQALRWEAFLFPALALGGGISLAELWRRHGALRWTAATVISAAIAQGAALWLQRLITYR